MLFFSTPAGSCARRVDVMPRDTEEPASVYQKEELFFFFFGKFAVDKVSLKGEVEWVGGLLSTNN